MLCLSPENRFCNVDFFVEYVVKKYEIFFALTCKIILLKESASKNEFGKKN